MVAYLGAVRPCQWVPDVVIIFLCIASITPTYIETMQPRLFEEWIEKGHQRDANLCGAYARPTNERSLVRGREGYNQGSFVYFGKACGDVEGRAVLSDGWDKPRCAPGTGSF